MGENQKSKKPWCVYFYVFPSGIGKIESESDTSAYVRYSENQMYPLELWDKNYLRRYWTLRSAALFFSRRIGRPFECVMKSTTENFPSEIKKRLR